MTEWPALALLFVLTALFGCVVWSIWRHNVVADLHAIRELLERRAQWEHELSERIADLLSREAHPPPP